MGTNYYWIDGRNPEARTHIGKSSAGWVFGLHVYPEDNINDLIDWVRFWDGQEGWIENEYNDKVEIPDMLTIITKRGREEGDACFERSPACYPSWESFHKENHSQNGPRGLVRSLLSRHCIKHGEGTWDCIVGEFS
jgi:hypothetical protein